ncbi:manganese catalase family protein [Aeromicrobium phragmitis]|uniref:Manganese catalase family protein n=1 Tax=Aeromicrobium phragmitis TaxID=2478914 RepID=A0A3L8PKB8_9ACTN|nr:manganese catalase family protein [Aeromicrobium phragmitis]RLV55634.1 manganese catalase family protein [Aeromicrobium phragmitis]
MFTHQKAPQFDVKAHAPDPAFARRFQEVLGGKWGEMTVAMQYLYQGWNARLPGKYRDMLMAIGTEELGHVEMIVTAIDQLLDKAPPMAPDDTTGSTQSSEFGLQNPQHTIVNGGGAYPHDSNGIPWSGAYITASGNLMADFHLNVTAEMQGRLQVSRLFHMTDDPGMKDLIRFLITRDHMHQMQWLSAIEELKADGLDNVPVPEAFPLEEEFGEFARTFIQASDGEAATEGRWANGPAPDGGGDFRSALIQATGEARELAPGDPRLYGTNPLTETKGLVDKAKDALS